jgi:hypothetical protein
MNTDLLHEIELLNPWLNDPTIPVCLENEYIPRIQINKLLSPTWDSLWSILTGPRQSGKTTLGMHLSQMLLQEKRFEQLLYLSCDFRLIREWLQSPVFIQNALKNFNLHNPIIFIDEVQRLESPGLLLKAVADLKPPIKMIASGSSQLEIKSKVQEFLTGRQFESVVLPISYEEKPEVDFETRMIFGGYPKILTSLEKTLELQQIFNDYIGKDIIEILKIGKPDVMQKLITLMAHSSGQLVQYQQLANDCKISIPTIQSYLAILEHTYVLKKITPFVGNKRSEVTSNPVYYFIDNGFRNCALRNFMSLELRHDTGLLIENFIFQEIFKFKQQHYKNFDIHFWRTTSGAEVDFVLHFDINRLLPIEVKYSNFEKAKVTRALRSFIQAYKPRNAVIITRNFVEEIKIDECTVHFFAAERLQQFFPLLDSL